MTSAAPTELTKIALSLDLPADATDDAILERIDALRLLREAATLDQVRRVLTMPVEASELACVAELCRRLPPSWHHAAVLAMQLVEMNERGRALQVDMIKRDATRPGSSF